MLSDKGTNIFSEIGKFFKENDQLQADAAAGAWAVDVVSLFHDSQCL